MGDRGILAVFAVAVLFGQGALGAQVSTPSSVLITGFEPFGGRAKNNSYEMAKRLKADPKLLGEGVSVEICQLPVVYDRAATVARACFEKLAARPDFVVSLGEGGCDIRLETAATNLDDTSEPDNDGVIRQNRVIDPAFGPRVGLTLPVDRSYCERPTSKTSVVPSISPGSYVCNNTAFLLAHYFRTKGVPYGFIHLQPESCGGRLKAADVRLMGRLLKALMAPVPSPLPWPSDEAWPTDLPSAQALLARVRGEPAPKCDLEFVQSLEALYAPASIAEKVPASERGELIRQDLVAHP